MAPPPEYDKEPKAPDKSASCEETQALYNLVNDQQTNLDSKSTSAAASVEVENNKHVETLDDGQLKALLDEAITYKCPKDREGKSSLFKELLEEVELDEQACEAAARGAGLGRARGGAGGGARGRSRRALPHSNSLQDLVAALAAEPAPRKHRAHPAHNTAPVSTRATHGGSLPSGVDTSFLLGEESSTRGSGAGYLATVRCVNPPPLAERRVSASDANGSADADLLNRRSKPAFPMTYTARATLEIGSGSVCSGRAVTTTTASNQVRTRPPRPQRPRRALTYCPPPTCGPPDRLYAKRENKATKFSPQRRTFGPEPQNEQFLNEELLKISIAAVGSDDEEALKAESSSERQIAIEEEQLDVKQFKLLSALVPKTKCDIEYKGGGSKPKVVEFEVLNKNKCKEKVPRDRHTDPHRKVEGKGSTREVDISFTKSKHYLSAKSEMWLKSVNNWYDSLQSYSRAGASSNNENNTFYQVDDYRDQINIKYESEAAGEKSFPNYSSQCMNQIVALGTYDWTKYYQSDVTPVNRQTKNEYPNNFPFFKPKTPSSNEECKPPTYNIYPKNYQEQDNNISWMVGTNSIANFTEYNSDTLSRSRQKYRERVGAVLVSSKYESINPKNIRKLTIGKPLSDYAKDGRASCAFENKTLSCASKDENILTNIDTQMDLYPDFENNATNNTNKCDLIGNIQGPKNISMNDSKRCTTANEVSELSVSLDSENIDSKPVKNESVVVQENTLEAKKSSSVIVDTEHEQGMVEVPVVSQCVINVEEEFKMKDFSSCSTDADTQCGVELVELTSLQNCANSTPNISKYTNKDASFENENYIELKDMSFNHEENNQELIDVNLNSRLEESSFLRYLADQEKLLRKLEVSHIGDSNHDHSLVNTLGKSEKLQNYKEISEIDSSDCVTKKINEEEFHKNTDLIPSSEADIRLAKLSVEKARGEQYVIAELPNNAYVFLTIPQRLLYNLHNKVAVPLQLENNHDHTELSEAYAKPTKKKEIPLESNKKKETKNKTALRALLFENLFKSDNADKSISKGLSTITEKEVDSAIPFSCITTPEVVASCNTTSSTSQSAVAVDPKPRSVISSSFNGLPLSRPNYGSTGSTTQDEYKKSLDENGNSVQGFSSPLSGSSQHKKPRRKKSSKNETVIKSHQIDGYQGNKDLNEVLRFIESNADTSRAHKLGRAKHKDDSDDKGGKKRSTERRKDKENKMKRATSMEELSRTKLEDLTDKPTKKERRNDGAPAKAERRSWGDDTRDAFYFRDEVEAPADEFQTVTKKRKPRRRADEPERDSAAGDPPRAPPPPSPRARRVSAPPSDRSADSNDDMDSVHSLPADAPAARAPAAPVSYADIARTRHNIPDLIESCNFYAEGEGAPRPPEPTPPAPPDDAYPALEPRQPRRLPAREAKAPPVRVHRKFQERTEVPRATECPAPDVVADRRPPVILLDSDARPRDMDGVTFGFDINEQLLGAPARRPRCDLVRDAMEGGAGPGAAGGGAGGAVAVAVRAGCALRYVAPAPPPDSLHLHQIVDYVGAAWEDVVRCGGGKVRYFSE